MGVEMEYYQLWINNLSLNNIATEKDNLLRLINESYGQINENVINTTKNKLKIINDYEKNNIHNSSIDSNYVSQFSTN